MLEAGEKRNTDSRSRSEVQRLEAGGLGLEKNVRFGGGTWRFGHWVATRRQRVGARLVEFILSENLALAELA
jgi:hypothetical protein